jgi:hypothetical protein
LAALREFKGLLGKNLLFAKIRGFVKFLRPAIGDRARSKPSSAAARATRHTAAPAFLTTKTG